MYFGSILGDFSRRSHSLDGCQTSKQFNDSISRISALLLLALRMVRRLVSEIKLELRLLPTLKYPQHLLPTCKNLQALAEDVFLQDSP